jgi:hypothetical protein
MEESKFDVLLQKAAQQTSRRETLGALLGGALLLGNLETSDANEKAKRRKKRKKRENASSEVLKDVSFWVNNRAGTTRVSGPVGSWLRESRSDPVGCFRVNGVDLAPGKALRYFTQTNQGYVFLNNVYWFDFDNWAFQYPKISAAFTGRHPRVPALNCPPPGTAVVTRAAMDVGEGISITMNGRVFKVKRHKDTSSNKIFEIIVPAGL